MKIIFPNVCIFTHIYVYKSHIGMQANQEKNKLNKMFKLLVNNYLIICLEKHFQDFFNFFLFLTTNQDKAVEYKFNYLLF